VRRPVNPAHSVGERFWMVLYAIASTIYRFFILIFILLFLTNRLPPDLIIIALIFVLMGFIAMFLAPIWKYIHYLATSGELARVRGRAVMSSVVVVGGLVLGLGLIPAPDRSRVEGFVEPAQLEPVYFKVPGFVVRDENSPASGDAVTPEGTPLLTARNRELEAQRDGLDAERRRLEAHLLQERTRSVLAARHLEVQIAAKKKEIDLIEERLEQRTVRAPIAGTLVAPGIEDTEGAYKQRGEPVGMVASLDNVIVRAVVGQEVAVFEADDRVEMRVRGRPDLLFAGTITKRLRVGQEKLPSAALGYAGGGEMAVSKEDPQGRKTAERFFEIHITPDADANVALLSGQRIVVRLEMKRKPYVMQWWRKLQQLIQKRLYL